MKAKSFHLSKKGLAQQVASELGRVYECVCDKLPPAYPCDGEKIVFVGLEMSGHLDKAAESFLKDLNPARARNVAIYVINASGSTDGLEGITKTLEDKGVHVAGKPLGLAVKGGLFKKSAVSDEDIQKAIAWAGNIIENELAK